MAQRVEKFPFRPKSTAALRPGQYWALPFGPGLFACGRVLQLGGDHIPAQTRAFFGGLHQWAGHAPPTAQAIAGAGFVDFGVMHICAITQTGGEILGERLLESDGIALPLLLSARGGTDAKVLRGADSLRSARRSEWGALPVLGFWGSDFIIQLAERSLSSRTSNLASGLMRTRPVG
jgi:hypothetical protein